MVRIGIPRALFYFKYYPLWKAFFEDLSIETVLSPPTNKTLLDDGVRACVNEACLPVKIFFGHVLWLRGKVDVLFMPRFISVHRYEFICPKFGGLPDMVRCSIEGLPPLLDIRIDLHHDRHGLEKAAVELGSALGFNAQRSKAALSTALTHFKEWQTDAFCASFPDPSGKKIPRIPGGPRILLLGHVYNVYDSFVNMNLIEKINSWGANVATAEMFDESILRERAKALERSMFWTFGTEMLGCVYEAIDDLAIDGIVCVTSFGCGPDAFIVNMAARRVREESRIPFLTLTLDEHSGEAGINTRLEAFLDTIQWKREQKKEPQSLYARRPTAACSHHQGVRPC